MDSQVSPCGPRLRAASGAADENRDQPSVAQHDSPFTAVYTSSPDLPQAGDFSRACSSTPNPRAALSWLDGALARFAADNDDLVPRTRALLDTHRRGSRGATRACSTRCRCSSTWAATRSCRRSTRGDIDQATLKHVAEEAHHAYLHEAPGREDGRARRSSTSPAICSRRLRRACTSSGSKARRSARLAAKRSARACLLIYVDDRGVSRAVVLRPVRARR